jgi:N-carbamoyl-L-amino-acid hydrolase
MSGPLTIDAGRLLRRIDELAAIGAIEGTRGCSRLALTDADRAGRDLVVTWMRDLGLEVSIDGIGNVTATMSSATMSSATRVAPVMTGSHIDTVATGGRYDGNLGVLAGLEVIETVLQAGIELARPLAVAFFTDEEGSRFPPDMLGSLVYVGGLPLEDALSIEGIDGALLGDELDRIGYRGSDPCPALPPHAFVELHIEQGPVLEREGRTIGAVSGVQGISWTEVTITGQSNHAGTTPMNLRRDPMIGAAHLTTFVHDLALDLGHPQVATVGKVDLHPNLVNVVPSSAVMTVDLRNTDECVLREAERRLAAEIERVASEHDLTVDTATLARFEPVEFDPGVVELIETVAVDQGHVPLRMPSGAGHDAQMLARVCPTAMVFVPSAHGLSHNPAEHTDPAELEAGANVLLHTMLALANGTTANPAGGANHQEPS